MLDKTGTITKGTPALTDVLPAPGFTDAEVLALVAAVERFSEHPLATAIVAGAQERGVTVPEATAFDSVTGQGVRALVGGREVLVAACALVLNLQTISFDFGNGERRVTALLAELDG